MKLLVLLLDLLGPVLAYKYSSRDRGHRGVCKGEVSQTGVLSRRFKGMS